MSGTGWAIRGMRERARLRIFRVLLCVLLFSAFQNILGALVVSTLASGPVVEICTAQGMQWVSLDALADSDAVLANPQGVGSTCAWSMAHMAVPDAPSGRLPPHTVVAPQVLPGRNGREAPHASDRTDRVLLMAPMRAPPLRQS